VKKSSYKSVYSVSITCNRCIPFYELISVYENKKILMMIHNTFNNVGEKLPYIVDCNR